MIHHAENGEIELAATMTGVWVCAGGFLFGMGGAWFMSRFALRLGLIDLPNIRSSHFTPTPRGGGVGILGAFVLYAILLHLPIGIWCPAAIISVLSFFDDRLELSPGIRLVFQIAAAVIVVEVVGVGSENSITSLLLKIFCVCFIVATTNFYNFMDGINGIAGITGVVGFLLIALFGHFKGAPQTYLLFSYCLALACTGFLPFNFPIARVFMGDVGSVLLGFMFGVYVLRLAEGLSDFFCLIAFILPFYADALTTIYIRFQDGEKLSQAHRRHLYQVLVNDFAHKHWQVSLSYGAMQLIFGLLMILAWHVGPFWQFIVIGLFSLVFIKCMVRFRRIAKSTV